MKIGGSDRGLAEKKCAKRSGHYRDLDTTEIWTLPGYQYIMVISKPSSLEIIQNAIG
jgi:hypothetical protein